MDKFLKTNPGNIPKKIHQIWVGPKQPPIVWVDTWRKKYRSHYSGWDYKLWGEAEVAEIKMRNQVRGRGGLWFGGCRLRGQTARP